MRHAIEVRHPGFAVPRFAELLREGSWVDARIDRALPDRKPAPRPDLRRMLIPVGPVSAPSIVKTRRVPTGVSSPSARSATSRAVVFEPTSMQAQRADI